MTDNDYARLDEILMDNIDNGLSIDEAHGFLSAIAVSNIELSDNDYYEIICADSELENSLAKEILALILDMNADIKTMLNKNEPFDILLIETEEQGEIIEVFEGWCHGFMLAVSQYENIWQELDKNEQSILSPIAKLALLISDEQLDMEDDEYDLLVELLPGAVMGLNSYFNNKLKSA
ncbi:hypothetical protein MNBD_GAMMA22-2598 [hydrothermal vent metagenome]|uniref:YecA family protein n=1 Tax=hydrothermal vent metagenome TaxID=652676 RepID=A0A3B1ADW6_9ZZZZ